MRKNKVGMVVEQGVRQTTFQLLFFLVEDYKKKKEKKKETMIW